MPRILVWGINTLSTLRCSISNKFLVILLFDLMVFNGMHLWNGIFSTYNTHRFLVYTILWFLSPYLVSEVTADAWSRRPTCPGLWSASAKTVFSRASFPTTPLDCSGATRLLLFGQLWSPRVSLRCFSKGLPFMNRAPRILAPGSSLVYFTLDLITLCLFTRVSDCE